MDVTFATEPTPGRLNEDHVLASPAYVVVLDGATVPAGVRTGCVHGVLWLVRNLGDLLANGLSGNDRAPLAEVLAEAITELRDRHAGACDLTDPDTPSATVALLRAAGETLDYLVLCDSFVVVDGGFGLQVVTDDRTARLPAYDAVSVATLRNAPGGFWVASADPAAAGYALTGSVPLRDVRRAALLSDGAARSVERFGRTWEQVLTLAGEAGPRAVIEEVRRGEQDDVGRRWRGKRFDDATLAYCTFPSAGT